MSIKSKILLVVIPLILLTVVLCNVAFWLFSRDYIQQQEDTQVNVATESVSNYVHEKIDNYLGSVNDWAHWDDTSEFVSGRNSEYVELNLNQSTFENLDLSFLILVDQANQVYHSLYYSLDDDRFVSFPANFSANMADVLSYAAQDSDVSFLKKIGDNYYFIAASEITDSTSMSLPNGRLIIGRIVDDNTLRTIETISGAKIKGMSTVDNNSGSEKNGQTTIHNTTIQKSKTEIGIGLLLSNPTDEQDAIRFDLEISRDLYLTSMQRLLTFTHINTISCTALAIVLIIVWGNVLTRPFIRLVSEVGQIDTESGRFARVSESGGKEITSLGKSINHLLNRIESGQKELYDSKKKLEATLTSVGDGVFAVDTEQNIVFMNPVAQRLTGWRFDDVKHTSIKNVFRIINEYTKENVPSPIVQVFEQGEIVELANHTLLVTKDGNEIPIEDTAAPIIDEAGTVTGCVLVFRDSSERKERQKRIEYLSYHDQLTELYNRRFFEEELRRLDVERNYPLSIVYADVNGLKVVNDAFGHESGDQLLKLVAAAMKTACRADDIIARIGGDEFLILLPKTDALQAMQIIERIKVGIGIVRFNGMSASVSFGVDTKTKATQSTSEVMNSAERNMYQAKIQDAGGYRSGVIREVFDSLIQKAPFEQKHSERVGHACEMLAKALDLKPADVSELRIAGELHDIGKVSLDATLLKKAAPLNDTEWIQMRKHPETGFRLLGTCSEYYNVANIVLAHHERIDGAGYPRGLKGEEISWKSRILAVAEAFDAMVHAQPYRAALSKSEAIAELRKNAGVQFDAAIVEAFIQKVVDSLPAIT
jgi:diguanylate cyclase (GGDEF)-like protein/PAS domain S-box-containing protein